MLEAANLRSSMHALVAVLAKRARREGGETHKEKGRNNKEKGRNNKEKGRNNKEKKRGVRKITKEKQR